MKRWYDKIKQDEDGTNLSRLFETEKEEIVVEGGVFEDDYDLFMREASE